MLTLDEVKGFLRIYHNEEDGYISVLLFWQRNCVRII